MKDFVAVAVLLLSLTAVTESANNTALNTTQAREREAVVVVEQKQPIKTQPQQQPPHAYCPNHCSAHGVCNKVGVKWVCVCESGFTGSDCSRVDAKHCGHLSHCSGRGECVGGECVCDQGFGSRDCSKVETDKCGGCRKGHCVETADGVFQCECIGSYTGAQCSTYNAFTDNCRQLGFCSGWGYCQQQREQLTCVCAQGFEGSAICGAIRSGGSAAGGSGCVGGCSGRGFCDELMGVCVCDKGWSGVGCNVSSCGWGKAGLVCSGSGICVSNNNNNDDYRCRCDAGYTGLNCNMPPCGLHQCNNHGNCIVTQETVKTDSGMTVGGVSATCNCDTGWIGSKCETNIFGESETVCCPQECSKHGICKDCSCNCFDGFGGPACDQLSPDDEPNDLDDLM